MWFLFVFFLHSAQAEEASCGSVSTANDILQCVMTRSPEQEKLNLERDSLLSESRALRRWINPELTNQSLFGKNSGSSGYQFQLGVWQSFELPERWTYKGRLAESAILRANAEYVLNLAKALREAGRDLARLSQIREEILSTNEARETFGRLVSQYGQRPRLSPEQEVSLSVYQLSQSDFLIRKDDLEHEQDQIFAKMKAKLGLSEQDLVRVLSHLTLHSQFEAIQLDWNEDQMPELKQSDSELVSAEATLSLARSENFSDIKFGPMIQFDSDGGTQNRYFGFQLSVPFPLLNQNGYGIQSAAEKLKSAEVGARLKKTALKEEWGVLLRSYERVRVLLKSVPSTEEIEVRHKKVEREIYRGLVNSAVVVESHRSFIELQKARHSKELEALELKWSIYSLQGKLSEIRL